MRRRRHLSLLRAEAFQPCLRRERSHAADLFRCQPEKKGPRSAAALDYTGLGGRAQLSLPPAGGNASEHLSSASLRGEKEKESFACVWAADGAARASLHWEHPRCKVFIKNDFLFVCVSLFVSLSTSRPPPPPPPPLCLLLSSERIEEIPWYIVVRKV